MKMDYMKKSPNKLATTPKSPGFQIAVRKRVAKSKSVTSDPISKKRDNVFSKSRDTREDRGMRQMKTTQRSQTLVRGTK